MGSSAQNLPPQDQNAERAVLGGMMRNPKLIADVHAVVRAEDFYVYAHQLIFRAALALFADGKSVDMLTLYNHLAGNRAEANGAAHDAEGPCVSVPYDALTSLWDAAPFNSEVLEYARIVRGKAMLRELVNVAKHIFSNAKAGSYHAGDIVAEVEDMIFNIAQEREAAQSVPLPQMLARASDVISDQVLRRVTNGISTGLDDLDKITGGFHGGQFVIVAARPGVGKTALALHCFLACADGKLPAVFFSLEQSQQELAERVFCIRGGINSARLRSRHLDPEECQAIVDVCDSFGSATGLHVCDAPGLSMVRIISEARRLKLRHGIRAVFVDYLQLVMPDNKKARREEQVAAISRRLKLLARELDVPVIALAQLNRNSDGQRPKLSELRESGSQEQDADAVYLMHNPAQNEPGAGSNAVIEVAVAKNRNGPRGQAELFYRGENMRFENYARTPSEP